METQMKTLLTAILPTWCGFIPFPTADSCIRLLTSSLGESKSHDGYSGLYDQSFEIDVMAKEYSDLIAYCGQIRTMLKGIEKTTQTYYIQSVMIDESSPEFWETEVGMNRKMITFTISYQK